MDKPEETIAPWSREKLEILDKYLRAYSTIMQKQKATWLRSYVYVDAFASVGQYVDQETGDYVDGSPAVALKCEPPFDRFWFVEYSPTRLHDLQARVGDLAAGREVHYAQGDANQILTNQVIPDVPHNGPQRGLVFLDPYGLQVKWDTVARLAAARSFDILMNLSTMGIVRLLDTARMPSAQNQQVLSEITGDAEWVAGLYQTQLDLFGETHTSRAAIDHETAADIYLSKVKSIFRYVSRPVQMRNSKRAVMYILFLASHNSTAISITNSIFSQYERRRVQRR